MPSIINASTSGAGGVITTADASGQLELQTAGTTAVTVTSSQNVGIGTVSPSFKLTSNYTANATFTNAGSDFNTMWQNTGVNAFGLAMETTAKIARFVTNNGYVTAFNNASAEAMRIDSSGTMLVNATSNPGSAKLYVTNSNDCVDFRNTGASGFVAAIRTSYTSNNGGLIFFGGSGGGVGSITTNNSTTSYNTSSDYRLKENVAPMTGALETVSKLKPSTYTWKNTKINDTGFIAHELQEIMPNAVTGEKDAVDAEGNPVYQGIDTSFLVATLTAAIQELKARIEILEGASA